MKWMAEAGLYIRLLLALEKKAVLNVMFVTLEASIVGFK